MGDPGHGRCDFASDLNCRGSHDFASDTETEAQDKKRFTAQGKS